MSFAPTTESRLALLAVHNGTCCAELVLGMTGLVKTLAGQAMNGSRQDPDTRLELEGEGNAALCEAVHDFPGTMRFSTFAGKRIMRAMVSYLRTESAPAGVGTEWRARREQEVRRQRAWLTSVMEEDPRTDDLAYVSGTEEHVIAAGGSLRAISLDDAEHELPGLPPEAEDGAEWRFGERWESLPRPLRMLVDMAETMGEETDGVSLTQLALVMHESRTSTEERLGEALGVLLDDEEA